MRTKVTSDEFFLRALKERQRKWGTFSVSAKITVPTELAWWYYNEYGTANLGVPGGLTYPIDPVTAKVLAFPGADGAMTLRAHVDHPGIHPSHMVGDVRTKIQDQMLRMVREYLNSQDFNSSKLRNLLIDEVMPMVLSTIVESIRTKLTGTRDDGRLKGKTAADVFKDKAQIIEITE